MRTRYMAEPVVKIANESRTLPRKKKKKKKNLSINLSHYTRETSSPVLRGQN